MVAARAAWPGNRAAAARKVRDRFIDLFLTGSARPVVLGYWPIRDEIDSVPLLEAATALGCTCALPVVAGRDQPLIFRSWQPGDRLVQAQFGLSEPGPDAPEIDPEIIVAPMLAANPAGSRLGYGGGFYDRTIRRLRATRPLQVIAIGYDVQLREAVPAGTDDQRVDWVLSERRAVRCVNDHQGR